MPPKSSTDNKSLVDKPEPYYTNEDVEILYKIVIHAQNLLPSLPERETVPTSALFAAYHALLPSIGIDADHDSRYARILFKIGGVRGEGSLFEKFEEILSRMDIELQFEYNAEKNDGDGATKTESQASHDTIADAVLPEYLRGRQRRNSESSLCISGARSGEIEVIRSRSHSAFSKADSTSFKRPLRPLPATQGNSQISSQRKTPAYDMAKSDGKSRDLRAWLNARSEDDHQQPRSRSVSSYGSIHLRQKSIWADDQDLATSSTLSFGCIMDRSVDNHEVLEIGQEHQFYPKPTTVDSETLLAMKDALVEEHYNKHLLRQKWRHWRMKALQLTEDNLNLEILAKYQDRRVLLRQAFDTWREGFAIARQRAETERFFAHLERRASRARDLFVLTKALTHWAQTAYEEIQWTSAARRHILRTRYFQPWRDISAVNELKVRRHIIRKFFGVWQSNSLRLDSSSSTQLTRFEHQLVRRIYWTWFWTFCERKAPPLWAFKLKRRCLAMWVARTRDMEVAETFAASYRSQQLKTIFYAIWSLKELSIVRYSQLALSSECRVVYSKTLSSWYSASIRQCASRRAQLSSQQRLKCTILDRWWFRARQERQATEIDRLKIKREAWVMWNDRVRCQTLQIRIDGRLVLQTLYKWVLAERLILANRLWNRRMMHTALFKMKHVSEHSFGKDLRDVAFAETLNSLSTKKTMVALWRTRLQYHFRIDEVAARFRSHLVLKNAFAKWAIHNSHLGQLEGWCNDAGFYFLASKMLKSWKDTTANSKRERRRAAYTDIRSRKKIKIVSALLLKWHRQTKLAVEIRDLAIGICGNKTVIIGIDIFDRWRARLGETSELHEIHWQNMLRRRLNDLRGSVRELRRLTMVAETLFEDTSSVTCLKRWAREALQLRALEHVVLELREKYFKKSSRKMIIHWRERTLQKEQLGKFNVNKQPPANLTSKHGSELWSGFGENSDVIESPQGIVTENATMAIPGYLSTPSKHSVRTRKKTTLTSTTPNAPLLTPVERHIRAQYSGGSLSTYRKTRSANLNTYMEDFRDVPRKADEADEGVDRNVA